MKRWLWSILAVLGCIWWSASQTVEVEVSPVVTDGSGGEWLVSPIFHVAGDTTGSVMATLANVPGWGDPGTYGRVELYASSGQLVGSQQTDTNSKTTFTNVSPATGYYCRGYSMHYPDPSPYGEQHWSRSTLFSVSAGTQTGITLPRNLPYCTSINIYAGSTDVFGGSVPIGTTLRIVLGAINPSLVGAEIQSIQGRMSLDRDETLPFDYVLTGTPTMLNVGQETTVSMTFQATQGGAYYHLAAILTNVSGTLPVTDGGTWKTTPLLTVYESGDKTAPLAPTNLAVTPQSWTNVNTFAVSWVDPSDPSGIVASWHRVGASPTNSSDGSRSTGNPIILSASEEGASSVYVWLEDGAGNKDQLNRASSVVYLDQTRPSGSITINSGAPSTNSLSVTLSLSVADQGGSGLALMRFSNDGMHWSDREPYQTIRNGWDLTQYGGNAGAGPKDVYGEVMDYAGNASLVIHDNISYSATSVDKMNGDLPRFFALLPNYPNPFNPVTTIPFSVASQSPVRLEIFDITGQSAALLVDEQLSPGSYKAVWKTGGEATGVYVCRMRAGGFVQAAKLLLVR
jgi:hypothetical protein